MPQSSFPFNNVQALSHFEQLGYPCPKHHNPAEFVADLVSPESDMEGKAGSLPGR